MVLRDIGEDYQSGCNTQTTIIKKHTNWAEIENHEHTSLSFFRPSQGLDGGGRRKTEEKYSFGRKINDPMIVK